jgi:hypothetical protein
LIRERVNVKIYIEMEPSESRSGMGSLIKDLLGKFRVAGPETERETRGKTGRHGRIPD